MNKQGIILLEYRYLKYEMKLATRTAIAKTNAHSEAVGVDKINP